MDYKEIIDKLVRELSYRVGVPNIENKEHQSIMSEILSEWGEFDVKQRIFEFLTEKDDNKIDPDTEITYQNKKGETRKTTYGNAIKNDKESPQYKAADALRNKSNDGDTQTTQGSAVKPGSDFAKKSKEREDRVNKKDKKNKSDGESKPKQKNKTLKQDMGSKPESFSKDNPTDEEFEQKVKEGIIKPQEYKESTIEVNGKTYNQPISYEEVAEFFENSKDKIRN